MKVLAIDTSQPVGGVALMYDGTAVAMRRFGGQASHLADIARAMHELLTEAGLGPSDLDRLAVVIGPGSFTGLRIGVACVKGLYAAHPLDVVTMTSLELLAHTVAGDNVCAMIDAKKDEVYAACYRPPLDGATPVLCNVAPQAIAVTDFLAALEGKQPLCFVGSGARRYADTIRAAYGGEATFADESHDVPSVTVLAQLAPGLRPLADAVVLQLEPFYIRPSDARLGPLKRMLSS